MTVQKVPPAQIGLSVDRLPVQQLELDQMQVDLMPTAAEVDEIPLFGRAHQRKLAAGNGELETVHRALVVAPGIDVIVQGFDAPRRVGNERGPYREQRSRQYGRRDRGSILNRE